MHGSLQLRSVVLLTVATLALAACGSDDSGSNPASTVPNDGALDDATSQELDSALEEVMDTYEVPGAVVDVRTPEGSWSAVAGLADLDTGEPVEAGLVWPLRSITKSIVTTVVAQLADEGTLDLDDSVAAHLDGVPNGERTTLRMLADMTSGVGDYSRSERFVEVLVDDPGQTFTLDELNEFGFAEGAAFEAGDDRVYSNTAPNVLARVIEEVTGQNIAEVIEERITEELGLANTSYPATADDWPGPHAQGYQPDDDGELVPSFNNFTGMAASGGMVSDVEDMVVWAEALGSGQLLAPGTHEQRLAGGPLTEGPEYDRYGMGIGEIEGWWGHTGEGLGYTSLIAYDPETSSTVVIFMNISQAQDEDGDERHAPTVLLREIASILAS